jgi:hypothetical protein
MQHTVISAVKNSAVKISAVEISAAVISCKFSIVMSAASAPSQASAV